MRIVLAYPPMIDEIDAKFHVKGQPCLFAWGDIIYNPLNADVPAPLHRHEEVHSKQQMLFDFGIEGWWRKYIDDVEFRLDQEIPAHRAEFRAFIDQHGDNRNIRRVFLSRTALRLASPLYGRMITVAQAKKALAA